MIKPSCSFFSKHKWSCFDAQTCSGSRQKKCYMAKITVCTDTLWGWTKLKVPKQELHQSYFVLTSVPTSQLLYALSSCSPTGFFSPFISVINEVRRNWPWILTNLLMDFLSESNNHIPLLYNHELILAAGRVVVERGRRLQSTRMWVFFVINELIFYTCSFFYVV